MIIVETPLRTIQDELTKLVTVEGEYARIYAKGAIDALSWLLSGAEPASVGGVNRFPPISPTIEGANVH